MKLETSESKIEGNWFIVNGSMQQDSACRRIEYLVNGYLKKVAVSRDGSSTLFVDPEDTRLWELSYLQSEVFTGGPPCLMLLSQDEARLKYPAFKVRNVHDTVA